jgi:hypothetical protein
VGKLLGEYAYMNDSACDVYKYAFNPSFNPKVAGMLLDWMMSILCKLPWTTLSASELGNVAKWSVSWC